MDTSDAWIRERSGIAERRIASAKETTAYMGSKAAKQALTGSVAINSNSR